jgi:DNA-binding NarL/FixJ family response regulator
MIASLSNRSVTLFLNGFSMSTNSCLKIVIADKNSLLIRAFTEIFKQDERFDVIEATTDGELFLKFLDRVSIDVGIIGWKMPFADGLQVLTKLREPESKEGVVVYSIADVPRQVHSLGGENFDLKAKPPEGLIAGIILVGSGKSMKVKLICFY